LSPLLRKVLADRKFCIAKVRASSPAVGKATSTLVVHMDFVRTTIPVLNNHSQTWQVLLGSQTSFEELCHET